MQHPIQEILTSIKEYAQKHGRSPDSIRLIAVSKAQTSSKVREAYNLGLRDFGENYADELFEKSSELQDLVDLRWVFIGQLQSNKIGRIVAKAHEIQSVATEKHARYIQRYVKELGKKNYPVWIVVNAGEEESKQGASKSSLPDLTSFISKECPDLKLMGVMAIPPAQYTDQLFASQSSIPPLYQELRILASKTGEGLLSLGMSGDLRLAIAAGSDCVRIGTKIFGAR